MNSMKRMMCMMRTTCLPTWIPTAMTMAVTLLSLLILFQEWISTMMGHNHFMEMTARAAAMTVTGNDDSIGNDDKIDD
jgi:hypothetical protein